MVQGPCITKSFTRTTDHGLLQVITYKQRQVKQRKY